jgi:hypothetical protein
MKSTGAIHFSGSNDVASLGERLWVASDHSAHSLRVPAVPRQGSSGAGTRLPFAELVPEETLWGHHLGMGSVAINGLQPNNAFERTGMRASRFALVPPAAQLGRYASF